MHQVRSALYYVPNQHKLQGENERREEVPGAQLQNQPPLHEPYSLHDKTPKQKLNEFIYYVYCILLLLMDDE